MMGTRRFLFALALLVITVLAPAAPVSAAVSTIDNSTTIAAAIAAAAPGDTIILNPGIYFEHDVGIDRNIVIRANTSYGHEASDTIIDAMNAGRIFDNTAGHDLTVDSLTLRNATVMGVYFGGAIFNDNGGTLTVTSSLFFNCSANVGGAIFNNNGGTVTITGSAFTDCSSWFGGAVANYYGGGTVTVTSSEFTRCTVSPDPWDYEAKGGAISNCGTLTVTSSTFTDCSAQNAIYMSTGGAIFNYQGTATITSSTFNNCRTGTASYTIRGGAILNWDGTLSVTSSVFNGCSSHDGGAIHNMGGAASISGTTFTGCTATAYGGAIFNDGGSLTITATSLFSGCTADYGGAINNAGTLTITSSTFAGCSATFSGGAIYNTSPGTVTISSSTFSGCSAVFGGAIHIFSGTLYLATSEFTGCPAGYLGGALYNHQGTATITSSTFSGCTANWVGPGETGSGGAIYTIGTTTITSSTFSGCSAASGGGAITNGGSLTMHFSRIVDCGSPEAFSSGGTADAENNWWGTNAAPPVGGNIDAGPWLVLGITADPAAITLPGTSAVRANLTFNSDTADTAGGGIFVPDAITNTFAMVSGPGSVSPLTDGTTNGVAPTTYTTGAAAGTANISATVDSQTVYVELPVAWQAPTVTGITPDAGLNVSGIAITDLAGSGFLGGASVRLMRAGHANITATGVTVVSPAQITCTLPITGAEAGAWDVFVINPDGQEGVLPGGFAITAPAPAITSITPGIGLNVSGIAITDLAGSGFLGGASVRLMRAGHANITATGVTVVSPAQITCTLPITGAEAGAWDVVVINPDGQEGVLPGGFTITAPTPVPTVTTAPTPVPTYSQYDSDGSGDFPPSTFLLMTVTVNIGGDSKAWQAIVTGTKLEELIVTGTVQHGAGDNVTAPLGIVYQYINLVPARYNTITNAVINFTVPQSWLEENHIDLKNIVLYRLTANGWEALPTTVLYTKDGTVYFSAQSAGFSLFAIAGTPAAVTPEITPMTPQEIITEIVQPPAQAPVANAPATTQTTVPPAPAKAPAGSSPFPVVPALAGLCCVGLFGGGWYVRRWWIRRQNPALFEEF